MLFLTCFTSMVNLFLGASHYHKGKEADGFVISSGFIFLKLEWWVEPYNDQRRTLHIFHFYYPCKTYNLTPKGNL